MPYSTLHGSRGKLPSIPTVHGLIRQTIRQRRRRLTQQQRDSASHAVNRWIEGNDRVQSASAVALYLAIDGELDTLPLIEQFWQRGKSVFLPVLHPFSAGNLLFTRYQPNDKPISHPSGLKQPSLDIRNVVPVTHLDIIFTPLVAFDAQGNRLGMGGGYYDRTLQGWRAKGIHPIGLAHDCQRIEAVPTQAWDIPLPEIITPSKSWRFAD